MNDPACIGGDLVLVRYHDDGDTEFRIEAAEQFHDFLGGVGIEVSGGFVCEKRVGIGHNGAGNGDPAAAARRRVR